MPTELSSPLKLSAQQITTEMLDRDSGLGAKYVGPVGMFALAGFLVPMVAFCLYGLVVLGLRRFLCRPSRS